MNWKPNIHIALTCAYISGDVYSPISPPQHPFLAGWGPPPAKDKSGKTILAEFNGQELLHQHPDFFGINSLLSDPVNKMLLKSFFARCYASQASGELVIAYRGTDSRSNVPADLHIGINRSYRHCAWSIQ